MPNDRNWYPNTSATHRITSDLNNLNLQQEDYTSIKQVHAGNGQGLPIHHLGSSSLSFPRANFLFKNIFHVPQIQKTYLSPNLLLIIIFILSFIPLIFVSWMQRRELPSFKASIFMASTLLLRHSHLPPLVPSWVLGQPWMVGTLSWDIHLYALFVRLSLKLIWPFNGHLHL